MYIHISTLEVIIMEKIIRKLVVSGMVLVLCIAMLTSTAMAATVRKPISEMEVFITEPYFTETHEPKIYVIDDEIPLVKGLDYMAKFSYKPESDSIYCCVIGMNKYFSVKIYRVDYEYPGDSIAEYASSNEFLGIPYVWGGETKNGFDCSGFVQYVYKNFGYELNRRACDQATQGTRVTDQSNLIPGDLVFFSDYGHVGIYIGDDHFVHASCSSGIKISSLHADGKDGSYYEARYCGATRII